MIEEWKTYDSMQISSLGRIKKNGKLAKQYITGRGYRIADVDKERFLVHRLVALAFLGDPGYGYYAHFKNDNFLDVFPDNLEWLTMSECVGTARKNGKKMRATLKPDEVMIIARSSKKEREALALKYKVDRRTIWAIQEGINWKWLTEKSRAIQKPVISSPKIPNYS